MEDTLSTPNASSSGLISMPPPIPQIAPATDAAKLTAKKITYKCRLMFSPLCILGYAFAKRHSPHKFELFSLLKYPHSVYSKIEMPDNNQPYPTEGDCTYIIPYNQLSLADIFQIAIRIFMILTSLVSLSLLQQHISLLPTFERVIRRKSERLVQSPDNSSKWLTGSEMAAVK
ncbi:hypothetical protein ABID13_004617 [Enterocloster citroniae]|uniref:Uncharacterized protein n=1 Tax=Enterocloster citroniae TaxID=358743 RepID=A0ABV2G401_9FIRM